MQRCRTPQWLAAPLLILAAQAGQAQIAINAGGPGAGSFVADAYATGGTAVANAPAGTTFDTSGVASPAPSAAYIDERYGNFSYTVPNLTPAALYRVRLHFVETYWSAAGKRVFNVTINGTPSLTNFDIYGTTGAKNKVTVKEFNVPASSSGNIAIQFASVVDNAKVDAIEVIPVRPISINAGGGAVGGFIGDSYASGGTVAANATSSTVFDTSGVVSPAPSAAYIDERYGNFTYTIPNLAPATTYRVRLHFVETYWTAAGQRVFNVTINGSPALTNFDIYGTTGAKNKVVVREFSIPASSNGTITIQFASVVNAAKVDAIEIIPPGTSATTTPPTTTVTVPVAPVISGATPSNGGDTLSWQAVTNATGYNVKRSTTSGGPYTVISNNQAGTTYTDKGLTNGSTYYYVVSAVNSAGEGGNSTPVSVVPVAPVTTTPTGNQIGINIGGTNDWMPERLYADLVRMSRSFAAVNSGGGGSLVPVDGNGWPTTDFSFYVFAGIDQMQGTYGLSFQGQATVGGPNGTIPLSYDPATNTSSGTFQFTNSGSSTLSLNFSGTRRTSSSALGTGVTQIKLMRPLTPGSAQPHPASELFNRATKAEIAKFQAIRFMSYLGTNSSAQTNWSDRPLPGWASFSRNPGNAYGWTGIGGPWEHVVRLANETGKDVWINIPMRATDDYVRKTAQLFAFGSDGVNPYTSPQANPVYPPLNPGLKLYVEYSNELWNTAGAFKQSLDNCKAASDELVATGGNSPLNFDKSWNGVAWSTSAPNSNFDWSKCWRRTTKRSVEISNIFRSVYGDAAMMTTVRPVLMSQLGYASGPLFAELQMALGYYDNLSGNFVSTPRPPSYYFYGAGGSAYYNPSPNVSTVDQLFADPGMNPPGFTPALQADMALVAAMGLRRLAYEGGPSLDRTGGVRDAVSAQAVNDPRMTTAVVNMHNAWSANGGDLLVYADLAGDFQWGFTSSVYNLSTPKLAAVDQLNAAPKPALTYGTLIPGSVSGTNPGACSRIWGCTPMNPATFSSSSGGVNWATYTFRAPSSGSRSVTLNFSSAGSAQVAVYVDGVLVGTQTTSGGPVIFSPGNLDAGIHGVIVKAVSGSFTLSSVAVQ